MTPTWFILQNHRRRPSTIRTFGPATLFLCAAVLLTACGGSSSSSSSSGQSAPADSPSTTVPVTTTSSSSSTPAQATSNSGSTGSCAGVSGNYHARVVVETSPSSIVQRCIGFATPSISATTLLSDANVTLGTQKYSFGVAICQVDGIPAHYAQCLPPGKPYWAMFISHNGGAWTSAPSGISDTTLNSGDSLGLVYDPPTNNPAPPPAKTA